MLHLGLELASGLLVRLSFVFWTLIFQTIGVADFPLVWEDRSGFKLFGCLFVWWFLGVFFALKGGGCVRCSDLETLLIPSVGDGGMLWNSQCFWWVPYKNLFCHHKSHSDVLDILCGEFANAHCLISLTKWYRVPLLCWYLPENKVGYFYYWKNHHLSHLFQILIYWPYFFLRETMRSSCYNAVICKFMWITKCEKIFSFLNSISSFS